LRTLKVNFCDFWGGFDKYKNNFFAEILSRQYDVVITEENPDLLIYSNYGNEYLKYDCVKIFFSAENQRPDFTGCDYAITFDYINNARHLRLPLCTLYYIGYIQLKKFEELTAISSREEALRIWKDKKKFCCIVVSNPHAKRRIRFFKKLSEWKMVDSGGRALNNIGGPIGGALEDKIAFIKQYKFVIAFENSSYPGYTTEKILEPFFAHCIPVYWGNPLIGKDFNTERFINYSASSREEEIISRIMEIDGNDEMAIDMLTKPVFPLNKLSPAAEMDNLVVFLNDVVSNLQNIEPVSKKASARIMHSFKGELINLRKRLDYYIGRNFR